MTFTRTYLIFFSILLINLASGQNQFDRIYKTNERQMIALDAVTTESGSYFILSKVIPADRTADSLALNVSKLKHKGDVDWSMDYYIEDSLQLETIGSIIITAEGGIMFNGVLKDTSVRNDKFIVKLAPGGSVDWAFAYAGELQDLNAPGNSQLSKLHDSSVTLFGTQNDTIGLALYANRINTDGEILWSHTMNLMDDSDPELKEELGEVIFTIDSSIVSIGTAGIANSSIFINKMDTSGQILWSRIFSIPDDPLKSVGAYDILELADSSFLIAGFYTDPTAFVNSGLLLRVDSLGQMMWSKQISFGQFLARTVTNNLAADEGGIVVSGSYLNAVQPTPVDFMIKLGTTGAPVWQKQFTNIVSQVDFEDIGELVTTTTMYPGVALLATALDTVEQDSVRWIPHLIKVDLEGITSCEDTVDFDVIFDLNLSQDTAIWESTQYDSLTEISVQAIVSNPYDVPILSLPDTSYCPGDPVMYPLDATVRGATSYYWYKADDPSNILSTDSIYIATEIDVQYVAVVEVGEDFCFTLCDTTTISDIDPPMVEIFPDLSGYCETRDIVLGFEAIGEINSIAWSTGETDIDRITVQDLGDYSVTVTNQCGDTGDASITIDEDRLPPADVIAFQKNDNVLCSTGEIILVITAPPGLTDIQWSTGETTPQISVASPGTYSVTATDDCMYSITNSIEVIDEDFLADVDISLEPDLDNCSSGQIEINLLGTGEDVTTVSWSTGQSNVVRIIVDEAGTYSVTAIDICGNSYETSVEVTNEQLNACGRTIGEPCPDDETQCLCYPSAFRPRSDEVLNKTFGPDNRCPEITEYQMSIFNRWGQKVFESNSLGLEWDGKHGGEDAQSDVYVYYVRYTAEGVEFITKGDITLIR